MLDELEEHRRKRGPACLSDLQIDTLLSSAPVSEQRERGEAHAAECAACEARIRAMRERRAAFPSELPLAVMSSATLQRFDERRPQARWPWARWMAAVAGAASVAAMLVVALIPQDERATSERTKGGPNLIVYVKRGEAVFDGERGGTYFSGDRLQFAYSASEPQHVAVIDVEQGGRVSVFTPTTGDAPLLVPAGRNQLLPGSTELDGYEGEERVLGVFCPARFSVSALAKGLATRSLAVAAYDEPTQLGLDPACSISVFLMHKKRAE